uniref:Secreted protein n=1 Tax=Cacopsylla melanoneura TaxID=428564 RepID=A0A8D8LJ12_9HEMI
MMSSLLMLYLHLSHLPVPNAGPNTQTRTYHSITFVSVAPSVILQSTPGLCHTPAVSTVASSLSPRVDTSVFSCVILVRVRRVLRWSRLTASVDRAVNCSGAAIRSGPATQRVPNISCAVFTNVS